MPTRNGAPLGVSAVTAAGGASCMGPMEIPAKGYMSLATDPSSASFGLWQPLEHHGFEVIGQALCGGPSMRPFILIERYRRGKTPNTGHSPGLRRHMVPSAPARAWSRGVECR